MDKSIITNSLAFILLLGGYILHNHIVYTIGIFAFSGAITNWLAVYMLFEKVPLLYGSGVIELKFQSFKDSISNLIMTQFFTQENMKKFLDDELNKTSKIDFTPLLEKTDFSIIFENLKSAVMQSSFGGMLGMFGGEKALEPLKAPFEEKMKSSINTIVHSDTFQQALQQNLNNENITNEMYEKIEKIIYLRMEELTPTMVKDMVKQIIKEHLGWLVVWGGIFGGLIGLVSSIII